MKKSIYLAALAIVFFSCKDQDGQNKTQSSEKPALTNTATLTKGSGIGPIKAFRLPEAVDSELADKGKAVFQQKCTACHMPDAKLIGPPMKGIIEKRRPEWIMNMIMNPIEMLQKDPEAKALLKEFNNVPMTNQNIPEDEARALLEYFRTL